MQDTVPRAEARLGVGDEGAVDGNHVSVVPRSVASTGSLPNKQSNSAQRGGELAGVASMAGVTTQGL